jgi:BssS protein family
MGIVLMRLDFLTHATQQPGEAQPGRNYALTPVQARYLAEKILSALATLESSAPPDGGGLKH